MTAFAAVTMKPKIDDTHRTSEAMGMMAQLQIPIESVTALQF